jgi:chemotaxis-related protein WspB
MLALVFKAGSNSYALDVRTIAEIVPSVPLQPIPHTPVYVAGLFNFRETPTPVIDLCRVLIGQPSRSRLSTRIILVHFTPKSRETHAVAATEKAATYLLGLLAESATEMRTFDAGQFKLPVVSTRDAPFLGNVSPLGADSASFIQLVRIEELLPEDLQKILFVEQAH